MSDKYDKIKEQCRLRAKKSKSNQNQNKSKIRDKREEARILKIQSKINIIGFNLIDMLKKIQDYNKIENETTRKCHISRLNSFFEIQKKDNVNLFDYAVIIDNMVNATYGLKNIIYKTNSKKNILESFLYCLDHFVKLEPVIRERYQDYYLTLKIQSIQELEQKKLIRLVQSLRLTNTKKNFGTFFCRI